MPMARTRISPAEGLVYAMISCKVGCLKDMNSPCYGHMRQIYDEILSREKQVKAKWLLERTR